MAFNETLNITWHDHLENLSGLFQNLYEHKKLVDVTLSCLEGSLKAHKIVLSACSPYFEQIFYENPCKHPVLILKGISFYEMEQLLEFMYRGSINVPEHELSSLMQTAADLDIKGLTSSIIDRQGKISYGAKRKIVQNENRNCTNEKNPLKKVKEHEIGGQSGAGTDSNSERSRVTSTRDNDQYDILQTVESEPSNVRDTRFKGKKRVDVHNSYRALKMKPASYSSNSDVSQSSEPRKPDEYPIEAILVADARRGNSVGCASKESMMIGSHLMNNDMNTSSESKDLMQSLLIPDVQLCNEDSNSGMCSSEEETVSSHEIVEYNYECSYCNKKFKSDNDLFCHTRGHLEIKPFSCDFCGSSFTRASHLARHRRTHTGERPFLCSYCDKSFARQDKLKLHLRSHDGEYKPSPFKITCKKQATEKNTSLKLKRPRGRPRKYPVEVKITEHKRRRGRPRKVFIAGEQDPSRAASENFTYIMSMPVETEINEPDAPEAAGRKRRDGGASSSASAAAAVTTHSGPTDEVMNHEPNGEPKTSFGDQNTDENDAVELLDSIRQIGECTIQAVSK